MTSTDTRPLALVTGVGRQASIGAAIAFRLAATGWDVATTYGAPDDARMPWGYPDGEVEKISAALEQAGARTVAVPADLVDTGAPERIFDVVQDRLGPVTALVLSHSEPAASGLPDGTIESFERRFAVNARAPWLLVREFARRFSGVPGDGRVVAIASDHPVSSRPYGASKGALDRIVLAAAQELAALRLTVNVINPDPVDTGWIDAEHRAQLMAQNPPGRTGSPQDTAVLAAFLCSDEGGWINGQVLHSAGGLPA